MHQHEGPAGPTPDAFHILDANLLRPGDVLLSTVPPNPASVLVRMRTGSAFSHAAICTRPPMFVEAVAAGTRPFTSSGLVMSDLACLRVLRLAPEVPDAVLIGTAAGRHAEAFLAAKCWLSGAIAAMLPFGAPEPARRSVFCSHLVALTYQLAGLDLVPGTAPEHVTPELLRLSPWLRDVTREVVEPVRPEEWPIDPYVADREGGRRFVDRELAARHRITDRMLSLVERLQPDLLDAHGDDFTRVLSALVRAARRSPTDGQWLDAHLVAALEDEGYVALPDAAKGVDALHADEAAQAEIDEGMMTDERLWWSLQVNREVVPTARAQTDEHIQYRDTYRKIVEVTGLKSFVILADVYARLAALGEEVLAHEARAERLLLGELERRQLADVRS